MKRNSVLIIRCDLVRVQCSAVQCSAEKVAEETANIFHQYLFLLRLFESVVCLPVASEDATACMNRSNTTPLMAWGT